MSSAEAIMVRDYGKEWGLNNFTLDELIASHRRLRKMVVDDQRTVRKYNIIKAAFDHAEKEGV